MREYGPIFHVFLLFKPMIVVLDAEFVKVCKNNVLSERIQWLWPWSNKLIISKGNGHYHSFEINISMKNLLGNRPWTAVDRKTHREKRLPPLKFV